MPSSGVAIDYQTLSGSEAELRARLPAEVHASPNLEKKIVEQTTPPWGGPTLHRFGDSSLYLSETSEGTAHCQGFLFFEAKPGTAAKEVEAPPLAKAKGWGFCENKSGHAGVIDGTPAFVVEEDLDDTVEITITPWKDNRWQETCGLSITFNNEFKAQEKFCESGNCDPYADRARDLAQTFDEAPNWGKGGRLTDKINAEAAVSDELPTFGRSLNVFGNFAHDSIFVPVQIGDEFFFARIGHSGIGWRTGRDYLVAFYRPAVGQLAPVAGIYVTKQRTGPKEITRLSLKR